MLTFNALLNAVGLDPADVRLVRHKHSKHQAAVYKAAVELDERFETYQRGQSNPKVAASLARAKYMASFVVRPRSGDTVFVGIWEVRSVVPGYLPDPFRVPPPPPGPNGVIVDAVHTDLLAEYRGKLVIDWGEGERAWVQHASRQDKPIIELAKSAHVPPFPGYLEFISVVADIDGIPDAWSAALSAVGGVYLLVHRGTGQQYVGSATGNGGFLQRWLSYLDGHGGNVGMRELRGAPEDYDVTILEVSGSRAVDADVLAAEARWKAKLGSKVHGLNRN